MPDVLEVDKRILNTAPYFPPLTTVYFQTTKTSFFNLENFTGQDPGETLTWTLTGGPSDITIQGDSIKAQGPDPGGPYTMTLTLDDGTSPPYSQTFTVNIVDISLPFVNNIPTINQLPGNPFTFDLPLDLCLGVEGTNNLDYQLVSYSPITPDIAASITGLTFSANIPEAQAGIYTLNLKCEDSQGSENLSFDFTVTPPTTINNPQPDQGYDVLEAINLTLPPDYFLYDSTNPSFTIIASNPATLPSWLTISGSTLTGTAPSNTDAGDYELEVKTTAGFGEQDTFKITINPIADVPVPFNVPTIPNQLLPFDMKYQIPTDLCQDYFSADVPSTFLSVTPSMTGSAFIKDEFQINASDNTFAGSYTIDLECANSYGAIKVNIPFTLDFNLPPVINNSQSDQSLLNQGDQNLTLNSDWFDDPDGDNSNLVITFTSSPSLPAKVTLDDSTMVFGGLMNGASSGDYTVTVKAEDELSFVTDTFTLTLTGPPIPNNIPSPPDEKIIGQTVSIPIPSDICLDYLGSSSAVIVAYSNSTPVGPLTMNYSGGILSGTAVDNDYKGTYNFEFDCTSDSQTIQVNFDFTLTENQSPIITRTLRDYVLNTGQENVFIQLDEDLCSDPDSVIQSAKISGVGVSLPYGILFDSDNRIISGNVPDDSSIQGAYEIRLSCSDEVSSTNEVFKVRIFDLVCNYSCYTCFTDATNGCDSCFSNAVLIDGKCMEECPLDTYQENGICVSCSDNCFVCGNAENCQICEMDHYLHNGKCYAKCPGHLYGNPDTQQCEECHQYCGTCSGPTQQECESCNTEEYPEMILIGTSCQKASCVIKTYYDSNDESCEPCHENCLFCIGPNIDQCVTCDEGTQSENSLCTKCDDIDGFKKDEQGNCVEICGDFQIISPYSGHDCDDGNRINGDGCSSECLIEFGYGCDEEGENCADLFPPTFQIPTFNETHMILEFSEPVTFSGSIPLMMNMKNELTHEELPYEFSIREIVQVSPQLIVMSVDGLQIGSSDGSERLQVELLDPGDIVDSDGNEMNQRINQISLSKQIKPSFGEIETVEGILAGAQSTVATVVVANVVSSVALHTSLSFMWGLINNLQVYAYILLLNVGYPWNIAMLREMASFATINALELSSTLIPDLGFKIFDEQELNNASFHIQSVFIENDIDSPYLLVSFRMRMIFSLFIFCFIYPIVLLVDNKTKFKFKRLHNMRKSFTYDFPLRSMGEIYIELTFILALNVSNLGFQTRDILFASIIWLIVAYISIMIPPFLMYKLAKNYQNLNKKEFKEKFGVLIDDIQLKYYKNDKEYQKISYYVFPLFLFQRFVISCVCIFLYKKSNVQVIAIAIVTAVILIFTLKLKPYSSKIQMFQQASDDLILIIVLVICFVISQWKDDMLVSSVVILGWTIFQLVIVSMVKNIVLALYSSIKQTIDKRLLKKMIKNREQNQRQPSTSRPLFFNDVIVIPENSPPPKEVDYSQPFRDPALADQFFKIDKLNDLRLEEIKQEVSDEDDKFKDDFRSLKFQLKNVKTKKQNHSGRNSQLPKPDLLLRADSQLGTIEYQQINSYRGIMEVEEEVKRENIFELFHKSQNNSISIDDNVSDKSIDGIAKLEQIPSARKAQSLIRPKKSHFSKKKGKKPLSQIKPI